jgi:hypothetical protein
MKKRVGIALLLVATCLMASLPTNAISYDGHWLVDGWRAHKRIIDRTSQTGDYITSTFMVGYITGVVDSSNYQFFVVPAEVTADQLMQVVGKYLDEHPEQWNLSRFDIVMKALTKSFPRK